MIDRPNEDPEHDGERPTGDLAPELDNSQQVEPDQAQDVTNDALNLDTNDVRLHDTEKVRGGLEDYDAQDLVDHMNQMVSSGRIDLSAFEGEPNHDGDDDITVKEVNGGWGTDPDQDGEDDFETAGSGMHVVDTDADGMEVEDSLDE
jgi:hypothetical protein